MTCTTTIIIVGMTHMVQPITRGGRTIRTLSTHNPNLPKTTLLALTIHVYPQQPKIDGVGEVKGLIEQVLKGIGSIKDYMRSYENKSETRFTSIENQLKHNQMEMKQIQTRMTTHEITSGNYAASNNNRLPPQTFVNPKDSNNVSAIALKSGRELQPTS